MRKTFMEFRNVSVRYSEEKAWVLRGCEYDVYKYEGEASIGYNGAGTSMIAIAANGFVLLVKGDIFINGNRLDESSVWDIRREVGMVFQNPDNQFVGTTVQDDVAFGMENRGIPREEMIKRIDQTLHAVGMNDYLLTE